MVVWVQYINQRPPLFGSFADSPSIKTLVLLSVSRHCWKCDYSLVDKFMGGYSWLRHRKVRQPYAGVNLIPSVRDYEFGYMCLNPICLCASGFISSSPILLLLQEICLIVIPRSLCSGSASGSGSVCFWASQVRIRITSTDPDGDPAPDPFLFW